MNPANQKIMVTASTPSMANLCANLGNLAGASMRYARAKRVQTEVKIRKLTSEGESQNLSAAGGELVVL